MSEALETENPSNQQELQTRLSENHDPKKLSREIGLEIASLCGKHFLKLNHLHYGYWPKDLKVDITNLYIAQEKYTEFLLSRIPKNIKRILDVGCGNGQNAKRLIDAGFNVDCVVPSPTLAQRTRDLIGSEPLIYQSYYEDVVTDKRYDLVLFSESFQYIRIEDAIKKTQLLLEDDGYLLISDVFKKNVPGKCPLSGGHRLSSFNDTMSRYPFELVEEVDITDQTAPNIDIENELFMEVGLPAWNLFNQLMFSRYPMMTKFLRWKYKKKITKIQNKYFSGQRTGQVFKDYKSYLLLLYKKTAT